MRPMREVDRRRLINRARDKGEAEATKVIAALLERRYKALSRALRRANLRKRLNKALWGSAGHYQKLPLPGINYVDDPVMQERIYARIHSAFNKAEPGSLEDWQSWQESFTGAIRNSLQGVVYGVYDTEGKYWANRGQRLDPLDLDTIISRYEARAGRSIAGVADDIRTQVLADITDWYNSDRSLPELIDSLGAYFSEERAAMIARTESQYIVSEVARDSMDQFGITQWNFDLAPSQGPYPCAICVDYANQNPHSIDDQFPPLHPNDRCGVVYIIPEPAGRDY